MALQHLFDLLLVVLASEATLQQVGVIPKETLQSAVVSPDGIASIKHFIICLEVGLTTAAALPLFADTIKILHSSEGTS